MEIKHYIPYIMTNLYDCGPCAMASALQIPLSEIKKEWQWKDYNSWKDDLKDSHWHHFVFLTNRKINFKLWTFDDLKNKKCTNEKTLILLHSLDHPYLSQHWAILKNVTNSEVEIHFGDNTDRRYTFDKFEKLVNTAWPNIIYTVNAGNEKASSFAKFYVGFINSIL